MSPEFTNFLNQGLLRYVEELERQGRLTPHNAEILRVIAREPSKYVFSLVV